MVARLCDVAPDGTSTLISRGALNLTHRDGHKVVRPLTPGERMVVDLELDAVGQAIDPEHRLRLAVSTTYWPWLWPSPETVTATIHCGDDSWLELPVRRAQPDEGSTPVFGPAEDASAPETEVLESTRASRAIRRDVVTGTHELEIRSGRDRERYMDRDLEVWSDLVDRRTIREGDPLSAEVRCQRVYGVIRGGVSTHVETESTMTADASSFHVVDTLEAYEEGRRVFAKTWSRSIARDNV